MDEGMGNREGMEGETSEIPAGISSLRALGSRLGFKWYDLRVECT